MITRRELLISGGTGVCLLAVPLASIPQRQPVKTVRIGFLSSESASSFAARREALRTGLRELGYLEGRNLVIEERFADSKFERLPGLAAELVQLKVDVIVAAATQAIRAAQKETATIPIVMVNVGDPVGSGMVTSLARPGGNTTGLSNVASDVATKHLEMLHSMVPKLSRAAMLVNLTNSSHAPMLKSVETAAQKFRVKILPVEAKTEQEIEKAFSIMAQQNAQALILARDSLFGQYRRRIIELAAKTRLPSISGNPEYAEAGGLMSYGSSSTDDVRRAATYVDKILKGANPGTLPVEQPTKFELVINRKTAQALGLTIPQSLLISADRVIE